MICRPYKVQRLRRHKFTYRWNGIKTIIQGYLAKIHLSPTYINTDYTTLNSLCGTFLINYLLYTRTTENMASRCCISYYGGGGGTLKSQNPPKSSLNRFRLFKNCPRPPPPPPHVDRKPVLPVLLYWTPSVKYSVS